MAKAVVYEIDIRGDAGGVLKTLKIQAKDAADAIRRLQQAANNTSSSLGGMRQAARAVTLSSVTGAIDTLNGLVGNMAAPFRSFESAMAAANTMAGKSGEDFDRLKDSIIGLSKEIPVVRDELADGLYTVISNGVPEGNWMQFLEQSAKASVGGIADLGQTVTVTSTLIKNYGMEWSAAGAIQDKIQMTAKNGVTSFEQLASALPRVSGTAAQLGVSMDELMAVFATTTGVTGNTSEVSTQLAAVLNSLVKPSSEAKKAAEAMGISFDAASVKACGGFSNFLQALDANVQAYAAQSGQLSETIYGQLFGSAEALRILGSLTGEQKDKFAENIGAMSDSAGTIETAYQQMSATADAGAVSWRNYIAALTDCAASAASAIAPYADLAANIGASITSLMQLSPVLDQVANAFQNWGGIIRVFTGIQRILNITLLGCPLWAIITALTGVYFALRALYTNYEPVRNWIDSVSASLKRFVSAAIVLGKAIWEFVVKKIEQLVGAIKKAWTWLKKFFGYDDNQLPESLDKASSSADGTTESTVTLEQAMKNLKTSEDETAESTDKTTKSLNRLQQLAKENPAGDIRNFVNIDMFDRRIAYLQELLKSASREEYVKISAEIEMTEAERDKFKNGMYVDADTTSFTTEADFNKQISAMESGMDRLTASERRKMEARIAQVKSLKSIFLGEVEGFAWKDTGGIRMDAKPVDPKTLAKTVEMPKDLKINNPIPEKEVVSSVGTIQKAMGGFSSIMRDLGGAMNENTAAWLNYAAGVIDAAAKAIPAIMAVACSLSAKSASETPVVGWIMAGAAIASTIAAFAAIPKFADGGLAYGPTLGLFGEYAGAVNNPEVVAPLNKLKDLIGTDNAASRYEQVDVRIDGRNLVAVLAKNSKYLSRI